MAEREEARAWSHSRKGRIVGREVGGDETWMHVEVAEDHRLAYGSEVNRGRVDESGDVVVVRREFMREIGPWTTAEERSEG